MRPDAGSPPPSVQVGDPPRLPVSEKAYAGRSSDVSAPEGVMTSAQAAAAIGCSTRTLARLVAEHRIGCLRWGAGRRRPRVGFTAQHIQDYLTSCQVLSLIHI